jgi:hypothetical protein
MIANPPRGATASFSLKEEPAMQVPIHPTAAQGPGTGPRNGAGQTFFHDPDSLAGVFLAAFRRDLLSFFPGCRIDREALLGPAGGGGTASSARVTPGSGLVFRLDEHDGGSGLSVRVSLFGTWYRVSVSRRLGLGPRDRDLIRAIGRVMELHHQVLLRWSRVSLLQLRRGMPEDHYVAACVEPSAYSVSTAAPSRISEAILALRTMALSTYENRRVTTGALILGPGAGAERSLTAARSTCPEALPFGVELTGLKSLRRLCDGRRTLFLVDRQGKLADLVDIKQWARSEERNPDWPHPPGSTEELDPMLVVPCARAFTFHALATKSGGHVCLVLSPNQEIKVFAAGVLAFVFAHGRWRVLDPESRYALWEQAVANTRLARVLFQTALDLAEERQGGLLVVVSDPPQAIGRLISPHDVLEPHSGAAKRDPDDLESPARPFSLFGLTTAPESRAPGGIPGASASMPDDDEPLSKRSLHYLARGCAVTSLDRAVLETLAGLDGALVTDREGRLLAFGAILRHDAHSLTGLDPTLPAAVAEGARTTAALAASHFGAVLKISEDGIVSCFLEGARIWDL